MAEIDICEIAELGEPVGLTVQFADHKPLPDSKYDVLQMGNEVTVVINESCLQGRPWIKPLESADAVFFPTLVLEGVIDGLINATSTATESLKTLRERVSNDAR